MYVLIEHLQIGGVRLLPDMTMNVSLSVEFLLLLYACTTPQ